MGCEVPTISQTGTEPILSLDHCIPELAEIAGWRKLGSQSFSEVLSSQVKNAFQCFGPYEVPSEDIPAVLSHIGFYTVEDEILNPLATSICKYSTVSLDETMKLADEYAAHDLAKFQSSFKENGDASGQLSLQCVMKVLATHGIHPLRPVREEMLARLYKDESDQFSEIEAAHMVAIFRATEGFSHREVDAVYQVFSKLATPATGGQANSEPVMKGSQLLYGLLKIFGSHCASHAKALADRFTLQSASETCLKFRSFLVLARRLQEAEIGDYRNAFEDADQSKKGTISVQQAVDALPMFGYTPLHAMIDEFLEEMGLNWDRELDFDDFTRFLRAIRFRSGFLESDLVEYAKLFNTFDVDESDKIDSHELRKLIRQLGHHNTLTEVRGLLKSVDFDRDGALSFEEILQLLRIHREAELKLAFEAHSQLRASGSSSIRHHDLKAAFASLGHKPSSTILEEMVTSQSPSSLSFDNFVSVLDRCRKACAQESLKRAGWSHEEFEFLRNKFLKCCTDGSETLDKGKFLWILLDLGVQMATCQERNRIVERVAEARSSALKAGVDKCDIGDAGDSSITVWVFAHLLRLLTPGGDDAEEEREICAREETKFSHGEVAEFSEIFTKLFQQSESTTDAGKASVDTSTTTDERYGDQHSSSKAPPQKHLESPAPPQATISRALSKDWSMAPRLPMCALRELLASFGTKMSLEENQQLRSKVLEITKGVANVDFPDFLRVMRWLLDTNFADINRTARNVAKQTDDILQNPRAAVAAIKIALYWSKVKSYRKRSATITGVHHDGHVRITPRRSSNPAMALCEKSPTCE